MSEPRIDNIRRHNGIAGQFSYSVEVEYDGEDAHTVTFVGSTYGGPIVMVGPSGSEIMVSRAVLDRIGSKLTPDWIREFFGLMA